MRWRGRRVPLVGSAVVLVVIALVVFSAAQGMAWHRSSQRSAAGSAAVAAARSEVIALTSISADNAEQDITRLLAGATAGFRDQFEKQAVAFKKALSAGNVTSTGKVVSAGLVSLKDDHAVVLIAATGTVQNAQTTTPEARSYRLRAELDKTNGTWLVAGLEFVA